MLPRDAAIWQIEPIARLTRFGFEARTVDVGALDHAIKKAVVDRVAAGGPRGWSPR